MNVDFYDDELPESYVTWAESFSRQRDNALLLLKLIGIPTLLSAVSFTAVHFINKKIGIN